MKRRFQIRVHPAGAGVALLMFLFLPSDQVLAAILALLWHECAHLLVMFFCGVRQCTVELTPMGGMADANRFESLSPARQAVCAASGVLGSAAAAWICWRLASDGGFWRCFLQCNVSLAMLNMLPFWPLDGARVCMAFAIRFCCENVMRRALSGLAIAGGVAMTLLGLYGAWHGIINPSLLLCGPYLCYAAHMGTIHERVRQLDRMQEKLVSTPLSETCIYVSDAEDVRALLPGLVGRFASGRYHLLVELEPQSGGIRRLWTEHQMLRTVFETENHVLEDGRR